MWNSRWENNTKAVLTREDVGKIRAMYAARKELKLNQEKIAKKFGVAQTTISRITRGAGWTDNLW